MLVLRKYGIVCSGCQRALVVGATELEETAQNEELRRTLVAQGWTEERIHTHRPADYPPSDPVRLCRKITQCRAEDMILLD